MCFRYEGHGFHRVSNDDPNMGSRKRRMFWLVLSLSFTAITIWQVVETCIEYAGIPVVTSVYERKSPREVFPTVIICPNALFEGFAEKELTGVLPFFKAVNALDSWTERVSAQLTRNEILTADFTEKSVLKEFYNTLENDTGLRFLNESKLEIVRAIAKAIAESPNFRKELTEDGAKETLKALDQNPERIIDNFTKTLYDGLYRDDDKLLSHSLFLQTRKALNSLDLFRSIVSLNTDNKKRPEEWIRLARHMVRKYKYKDKKRTNELRSRVISCRFEGLDCVDSLLTPNHKLFSTCLAFSTMIKTGPGVRNGLVLTLRQPNEEAESMKAVGSGYTLTVADQEAEATSTKSILHIPARKRSDVGIHRTEYHRLPPSKGGTCGPTQFWRDKQAQLALLDIGHLGYSDDLCQEYFNNDFLETCNCTESTCGPEQQDCLDTFFVERRKACPSICREIRYEGYVSSAPLNQKAKVQRLVLEALGKNRSLWKSIRYLGNLGFLNKSSQSYTEVNIFFETSSTMIMEEGLKYNFLKFISSLGNTANVFLSLSFISVFQFVELFLDLLLSFCTRKKDKPGQPTAVVGLAYRSTSEL